MAQLNCIPGSGASVGPPRRGQLQTSLQVRNQFYLGVLLRSPGDDRAVLYAVHLGLCVSCTVDFLEVLLLLKSIWINRFSVKKRMFGANATN